MDEPFSIVFYSVFYYSIPFYSETIVGRQSEGSLIRGFSSISNPDPNLT